MNRRGFFHALATLAAGATAAELDPERLLWVPGAKTFFLPPPVSLVSAFDLASGPDVTAVTTSVGSQFVTVDFIAQEALKILQSNLALTRSINRQYDARYWGRRSGKATVQAEIERKAAHQAGFTVSVKLPARYGDPVGLRPGEELITIKPSC